MERALHITATCIDFTVATVVGALARKALVMLIFFMKFLVTILAWIDFSFDVMFLISSC